MGRARCRGYGTILILTEQQSDLRNNTYTYGTILILTEQYIHLRNNTYTYGTIHTLTAHTQWTRVGKRSSAVNVRSIGVYLYRHIGRGAFVWVCREVYISVGTQEGVYLYRHIGRGVCIWVYRKVCSNMGTVCSNIGTQEGVYLIFMWAHRKGCIYMGIQEGVYYGYCTQGCVYLCGYIGRCVVIWVHSKVYGTHFTLTEQYLHTQEGVQ